MIFCRAANCEIPREICEQTQNGQFCRRCDASTRKCTVCGGTGSITDPLLGRCQACVGRTDAQASEDACDDSPGLPPLTELLHADTLPEIDPPKKLTRQVIAKLEAQKLRAHMDHQDSQPFELLLEHCISKSDGTYHVPAPIRTLAERGQMTAQEAERILSRIINARGLSANANGNLVLPAERFARQVAKARDRVIARYARNQDPDA